MSEVFVIITPTGPSSGHAYIVHIGGPFFINDLIDDETTDSIVENDWEGNLRPFSEPGTVLLPIMPMYQAPVLQRQSTNTVIPRQTEGCGTATITILSGKQVPNTLQQYGENAMDAVYIDMSGCYPLTRCYFEYNEEDGLYYRSSIWLAVQTVLIQSLPQESSSVLKIF